MSRPPAPLVVNDWSIYPHPIFLDQFEALIEEVEARKARDPDTYKTKNSFKRLAAIKKVMYEVIPSNPAAAIFRPGKSLGAGRQHWSRAKFLQQYRLFYRFDFSSRVIVLVWVNDETSLRAYGSKTDAYAIFKRMLGSGNPPDDFAALLTAATASVARFARALKTVADDSK